MSFITSYQKFLASLSWLNGIPALLLRLYLAPVFIMAGYSKLQLSDEGTLGWQSLFAKTEIVEWFGNTQWGLGLPFPELLANVAAWFEFFGGWFLLVGIFTRLITIPLIFTMIIAATSVHGENGWFAITPTNANISPAKVLVWLGIESAKDSLENSEQADMRLQRMRDLLAEHGETDWLYEKGNIVILNNGIEFAMTYLIMLLALLFIGAGRFTSIDYYLYNHYFKSQLKNNDPI